VIEKGERERERSRERLEGCFRWDPCTVQPTYEYFIRYTYYNALITSSVSIIKSSAQNN
jgi:hypothetical protein